MSEPARRLDRSDPLGGQPASASEEFVVQVLRRSSLFEDLTASELATLAGIMHRRRRPKGDTILTQDEPGNVAFLIVDGSVNVTLEHEDGRSFLLRRLGPGDLFGEMSLLDAEPRSASVVAASDVDLLILPRKVFIEELLAHPRMTLRMLVSLSRRLRLTTSQVAAMAFDDAAARLSELLTTNARQTPSGLMLDATQEELAHMVGTTRQTVARIFADWRRRGYIRTGRHQTFVLRPAELREQTEA
jgi:CRP/FNR family cyclic AMP-dependent transcriptional regulator